MRTHWSREFNKVKEINSAASWRKNTQRRECIQVNKHIIAAGPVRLGIGGGGDRSRRQGRGGGGPIHQALTGYDKELGFYS